MTASARQWINVTTLGDMLDQQAERSPDNVAITFPEEEVTYEALSSRAQIVARGLVALGVGAGDRVGYLLPDMSSCFVMAFAAAKLGAICVPLNNRFQIRELAHAIGHSGMKVLFTTTQAEGTDFAALLGEVLAGLDKQATPDSLELKEFPELKSVVFLGDGEKPGMVSRGDVHHLAQSVADEEVWRRQQGVRVRDAAMMIFTSGTTALPKGALLSHEAFSRYTQAVISDLYNVTAADKIWTMLPLFHIGGLAFGIGTFGVGATYVHTGFFEPGRALEQLRLSKATVALPVFDQLWLPVVQHPECRASDLASLRVLLLVGTRQRLAQIQALTPSAALVSAIGMTESCAFVCLGRPDDDLEARLSTGGHPVPGTEVRLTDVETGELIQGAGVGELWFRGPLQFSGYFRDPEKNAEPIDEAGFFRTGDIVTADEAGRLSFTGRVKDMLKVGGENVAAVEIEDHLITHPVVHIAQVVSAPDARYQEVPAAYIELKPGATVSEQELIDHCRGAIATFKVPRYVRFVTEWPMSGTKVKKVVLREWIARELKDAGITEAPKISSA